MKTAATLFIALVMPFGMFILAGILMKRAFSAYRRRQLAAGCGALPAA